eukprot:1823862-Amphidinium_carterae.2
MRVVEHVYLDDNGFQGVLPEIGLQSLGAKNPGLELKSLNQFVFRSNFFKGTLPEIGLQSMRHVRRLDLGSNHFKGALPEIGLRAMRAIAMILIVDTNGFAGALPDEGLRKMTLNLLSAGDNCIQGHARRHPFSTYRFLVVLEIEFHFFRHPLLDQKLLGGICASNRIPKRHFVGCNTSIAVCTSGVPQAQLADRANSRAIARRQEELPL